MNNDTILKEFEEAEAISKGHFILSSGLHSDTYLQCARILMDPQRADRLCKFLAEKILEKIDRQKIDLVISPAMGGVIVGYEMARQLNLSSMFCERVDGKFELRRGFSIDDGSNILVIEDVVTTGKSSLEAYECIRKNGGNIVAEACLVDRSNGSVDLGVPLIPLISLDVKTYDKSQLPDHLKETPGIKPGSRWLSTGK